MSRPAKYDGPYAADAILFDVLRYAREHKLAYIRPATMARDLTITYAEAIFSLRFWKAEKMIGRRDHDGRWYYDTTEPWRHA